MLSSQEQMEIIKEALSRGYNGPIYELIDQAIIEKQSQQNRQQPQTPEVGTPALGGDMPIESEPTSTEKNIIRPGQYETGGLKSSDPDCKECGGARKYEDGGNPDTNLSFSISGPMYDLNGKCYANCAQRNYSPRHNLSIGSTVEGGSEGIGMGLWGGYTLNPDYGRKQEGFKTYIGANAGGALSGIKASDFVGTESDIEPKITPYANAVVTAGYEGEAGDGSSYQEYLKGRRGDPLKWGIGAYAKKDLLGDKGFTFGGYGHYGKLNVSGGYNTQTGPEFKAGIGIPIRKTGGVRKFSNGGKKDKGLSEDEFFNQIPENFDWDNVSEEDKKKYNILDEVEIKRYGIDLTMYKNARQMREGLFKTPSHGMWPGHLQSRMVHPENAADFGYDYNVDATHLDYWDDGNRSTYQEKTKTGEGIETSRIYLRPEQMKRYLDYANTNMDASSGGIGSLGWDGYNFLSNNCAGVNCDGLGVGRSGTRELGVVTPEKAYYKIKNYDFETGRQRPWRKEQQSQYPPVKSIYQSIEDIGDPANQLKIGPNNIHGVGTPKIKKGGFRYKNGGKKGQYPAFVQGKRQEQQYDLAMSKGWVYDTRLPTRKNQSGPAYFFKQEDLDKALEKAGINKATHYSGRKLNKDGLLTLDQSQGDRFTFSYNTNDGYSHYVDDDENDRMMKLINTGNWGYNPSTGQMVELNKPTKRQLTEKEHLMDTEKYAKLNIGANQGFTSDEDKSYIKKNFTEKEQEIINKTNKDLRKGYVGDQMKLAYQNPIMYAPGAIYMGAVAGPTLLTAANTPLMSGVAGTSLLDIAGAYGGYHAVTEGPEDVKEFIKNPSLSTGFDVGMDILGAWGGLSTTSKLLGNLKHTPKLNTISNITSNTPTAAKGTVSRNIANTNEPIVRATSEEIRLIDKGIKEGTKHYKTNIIHPENERRLNTMGRWGEQWKQNWNTAVKHQTYKPFQVSGEKASRYTLGQSGNVKTSQMGD